MHIPGFSTPTLVEFHSKVCECLSKDDANPSPDKLYGVRTYADWRDFATAIEAELTNRQVPFQPIAW